MTKEKHQTKVFSQPINFYVVEVNDPEGSCVIEITHRGEKMKLTMHAGDSMDLHVEFDEATYYVVKRV